MSCARPIDAATLADYWLAALPQAEEEVLEKHLLECESCGARLREVMALADGVRRLAREGSLRIVVTDEFLRRMAGEGLRVREYAPPPGGSVQCTVTAEDDLLIGRLAADLRGAKRVDLCLCDGEGVERLRMADVPFHAGESGVLLQESITHAKAAPSETMVVRMVRVDDAGAERVLGEYTFHHTRSLPGPGAW